MIAGTQSSVTHPGVHEDKVHLHEGENHLEQRVHSTQDLVALGGEGDLEEGAQLQSSVDHGAQSKG